MKVTTSQNDHHSRAQRYSRDTIEFSRVVNLSDALFAIVMTLLVFTLTEADITLLWSGSGLFELLPQLIVVMLSFALVANLWWQHHGFFEMLGLLEPGLIIINLILLGAIALVPFITNLLGSAPTSRVTILPFITLFILISFFDMFLVIRAHKVNAWRRPISTRIYYWLVLRWMMGILVMLIAFIFSLRIPLAGLIILGISITLGPLAAKNGRISNLISKSLLNKR